MVGHAGPGLDLLRQESGSPRTARDFRGDLGPCTWGDVLVSRADRDVCLGPGSLALALVIVLAAVGHYLHLTRGWIVGLKLRGTRCGAFG